MPLLTIAQTGICANGRRKKTAKIPTTSTPKVCRDQLHNVLEKITGKELSGCDLCVKLMSRLKAHILSHPRKVPVEQKDEVTNNGKEKEVNAKLHRCVLCKQSFTQASDLSKHIFHHVRQKEQGKQETAFKTTSPAPKVKSGRILNLSSIVTSASVSEMQKDFYQNELNQLKNNKTRVSYIIRTRKSIIRTRCSSRLTLNDQKKNESKFEAEENILVEETKVNSNESSKSCPTRVPDSNFVGKSMKSTSKTPFQTGDQTNNLKSNAHTSPVIWHLGRLSKNIDHMQPSAPINAVQHSRSSIVLASETVTQSTSSSSLQMIPESLTNDEASSLPGNPVLSSSSWESGSDLMYATILMPTPPRKLGLRFPRKALKPRNRQIQSHATILKKSSEDPLEMLSQEN